MIRQSARRVVAATTLILGASTVFIPSVLAGDSAGNQQGEMPAVETVAYTPATKFNFTPGTTMTGQSFGSVNVRSNSGTGWLLEVKSLEGSALKHTSITTAKITYSLSVDSASTAVTSADTYVTAKDVNTLTCSAAGGCDYNVTADIDGTETEGKPTGTYQDTITFKLTNK